MAKTKKEPVEAVWEYASASERNPADYKVRVGKKVFPMSRWREAILYYLFGIWSGDPKFRKNPEIRFGNLTLTLYTRDCRVPEKTDAFSIEGFSPSVGNTGGYGNYTLYIGSSRLEVMDALARFAKDPYLAQVIIDFEDGAHLAFFRKERRGEYGCFTHYELATD